MDRGRRKIIEERYEDWMAQNEAEYDQRVDDADDAAGEKIEEKVPDVPDDEIADREVTVDDLKKGF